jgi:hypothetical protein
MRSVLLKSIFENFLFYIVSIISVLLTHGSGSINYKYGTGFYPATRRNRDPYLSGSVFSTQEGSVAGNSGRPEISSVADPGCLSRIRIFSITDPEFASKNLSILTPKNCF